MANDITSYLEQIKTASLGEEVRGSIYESIKLCYDDSHGHGIGSKDLTARHSYDVLVARNGGNLSETQLYPTDPTNTDADLHYIETNAIVFANGINMADYDYIGVWYKVQFSAAPQLFLFRKEDFVLKASVVDGIFTSNGVGYLRRIHVKPSVGQEGANCKSYDISEACYFNVNTKQVFHIDSAQQQDSEKLAGVVTRISGFNFRNNDTEVVDARGINPDTGNAYDSLGARLDAIENSIGGSSYIDGDTLALGAVTRTANAEEPDIGEPPLPGGE